MYKLGNVLIRQTWRNAHAWANRRLLVTTPLLSTCAPDTFRLVDRVNDSQGNKSRFLSTLVVKEEEEKQLLNPFILIGDDKKDVFKEIIAMIRTNIRNTDMYNIATNYYNAMGDSVGLMASAFILLSKSLNYHLFNDATLTHTQRKVIAIVEVLLISALLHDDIIDNTNTRQGLHTAHKLWPSNKVVVTGNMLLGVAFGEASKLENDVNTVIFQMYEVIQRGQLMHFKDVIDGDIYGHYMTIHDYKNSSLIRYVNTATALVVGAKNPLVDTMGRLGFNLGMLFGIVDDIADFEEDLANGLISAPAIFATREYPELKEMILRRFAEEGDVEKTIELVNKSQGFEEARTLARMYHGFTMSNLRVLADSPYRRALESVAEISLLRIVPGAKEIYMVAV